jgi:hypothetical protein
MNSNIWYISLLIVSLTLLLLLLVKYNNIQIHNEYKYLAGAIGISGFLFAVLGDGLFVTD